MKLEEHYLGAVTNVILHSKRACWVRTVYRVSTFIRVCILNKIGYLIRVDRITDKGIFYDT